MAHIRRTEHYHFYECSHPFISTDLYESDEVFSVCPTKFSTSIGLRPHISSAASSTRVHSGWIPQILSIWTAKSMIDYLMNKH
ncbi:unnamed protein product [Nezara viridula]|uniref:Uncharacterized protein n=1 Tax=Nezara viridula TaxID=85310 RepID=A0A9P0GVL4_NEZVI|nr:unnamed protein product [Nezara viridula]